MLGFVALARAQDLVRDTLFTAPVLEASPTNISTLPISLAAHPDGSVLIATQAAVVDGQNVPPLVKMRSDGSLDAAFVAPIFARRPQVVHVYADARLLVHNGLDRLLRLLPNGAVDPSFTGVAMEGFVRLRALELRDGRLLVGGFSKIENSDTRLAILGPDGRLDRSFNSRASAVDIAQEANGRLIVAGSIPWLNGSDRSLARLNLDGSVDTSFDAVESINQGFNLAVPLPDGRVLAANRLKLYRFLANGTVDATYRPELTDQLNAPSPNLTRVNASGVLYFVGRELEAPGANRLIATLQRLTADGRVDPTFKVRGATLGSGEELAWSDRRPAPVSWDERSFYLHNPATNERFLARQYVTRVNASGAIDPLFAPRVSPRAALYGPLVRGLDGKYFVWGNFDYIAGVPVPDQFGRCVRLNANGSVDRAFQAPPPVVREGRVYSIQPLGVQPDGRVLVLGDDVIWRLGTDGARDLSFPRLPLRTVAVARDGSFVGIETVGGRVSRYQADGTRDASFNTTTRSDFGLLAVAPDGRVLIQASDSGQIVRLNLDGSRDTSYTSPVVTGENMVFGVLANGSLVACGRDNSPFLASRYIGRIMHFGSDGRRTFSADVRFDLRAIAAALHQVTTANGGGSFAVEVYGRSNVDTGNIQISGDEITVAPAETDLDNAEFIPLARFRRGNAGASIFAPEFFVQPVGRTVTRGVNIQLNAQAYGQHDLTYQWYKDGVPLRAPQVAAAPAFLNLTGFQAADAGDYYVEVRNATGTTRSAVARLEIATPPVLLQEPPAQITVAVGQPLALTLNASGNDLRYTWQSSAGAILYDSGILLPGGIHTAYFPDLKAGDSGTYRATIVNSAGLVRTREVTISVVPNATPSRLDNVSVRTHAGNGDDSLIVGFVVSGEAQDTIPVLIRGAGPALAGFGVPNVLTDPRLSFRLEGTVLAENDDWGGDTGVAAIAASVGAFPFADVRSRDAALHRPAVSPGSYTVQISGAGGGTGTALAEIYAAAGAARIVNLSSRARVRADEPLIAGFVIAGETAQTLLLRGVGPGLALFGVQDALPKAELSVFDSAGRKVVESTRVPADAIYVTETNRAGAFTLPSGESNAAILVTLPPGPYTAQVRGANGTTGAALVEVYQVR
jgi:uncharacterized delta-60 repeat protein